MDFIMLNKRSNTWKENYYAQRREEDSLKYLAEGGIRGELKGELKTLRRLALNSLQKRLGDVPEKIRILIANSANTDILMAVLDQVWDVDDLRSVLPQIEKLLSAAGIGRQMPN